MKTWLTSVFLLFSIAVNAQSGLQLYHNNEVIIPFQFISNIIIIPVHINGVELHFVLDSGVAETLLFSLENKEVRFNNVEKSTFMGLGGERNVEGLISTGNTLVIGEDFVDSNHKINIILDEDFNISSHLGVPVNGIIGYEFFKNYLVKINYVTEKITIYPSISSIKDWDRYDDLDLIIEGRKPYILAKVGVTKNDTLVKMLMDLGNADAVWLFPGRLPNFHYHSTTFEDYLGRGFNGDINGKRGRIYSIALADNKLFYPIAAMPDEGSIKYMLLAKNRVGSVGSEVMSRFHLIVDYPSKKIHIRKNRNFNEPFKYNMSGLDVRHKGMQWEKTLVRMGTSQEKSDNTPSGGKVFSANENEFRYQFALIPNYIIVGVRDNSPGSEAGIQKEDELVSIKGIPAAKLTLQDIYHILSSKEDKSIRIVLRRGDREIHASIILRDPLPYLENIQ